jgi:hypothetical protein
MSERERLSRVVKCQREETRCQMLRTAHRVGTQVARANETVAARVCVGIEGDSETVEKP